MCSKALEQVERLFRSSHLDQEIDRFPVGAGVLGSETRADFVRATEPAFLGFQCLDRTVIETERLVELVAAAVEGRESLAGLGFESASRSFDQDEPNPWHKQQEENADR